MSIQFELDTSRGYVLTSRTGDMQFGFAVQGFQKSIRCSWIKCLNAVLIDIREVTGTPTAKGRFTLDDATVEMQAQCSLQTFLVLVGHVPLSIHDGLAKR